MNNSMKYEFRYTEIASYVKSPFEYEKRYGSEKAEILKSLILNTPKLKELFFPDPTSAEIENTKYAEERFYKNYFKQKVIYIPQIIKIAASSTEEKYPIHFKIIEIDKEPEKNDSFQIEITQQSKVKLKIKFWSKNPLTNRKFTLCLKIKEQEIEIINFENLSGEVWEYYDVENESIANIPWHSVNVDDFHKLYLRVVQ